jgi:riboflavin kinase/FMN adenylyltransferase
MKIYRLPQSAERPLKPFAVAIGNFDGLHLGHQSLIKTLLRVAREKSLEPAVFTFDPHPMKILLQRQRFLQLWPREELAVKLSEYGIKHLFFNEFDLNFAATTPDVFLKDVFLPLKPSAVVIGFDFHFGAQRAGTPDYLRDQLLAKKITVEIAPEVKVAEQKVSSRWIKECLSNGNLELAASQLGEFYYIKGDVVSGDQRGHQIGFPTANLATTWDIVLRPGVYKTSTWIQGKSFKSVTNIGKAPTFVNDSALRIETHILDFNRNIYNQPLKIEFLKFIRTELKFAGKNELVSQIKKDIHEAWG